MAIQAVVDASEALVSAAGAVTPTARLGAAALALALGRVVAAAGLNLEGAVALVRLSHGGGDLAPLPNADDEELFG